MKIRAFVLDESHPEVSEVGFKSICPVMTDDPSKEAPLPAWIFMSQIFARRTALGLLLICVLGSTSRAFADLPSATTKISASRAFQSHIIPECETSLLGFQNSPAEERLTTIAQILPLETADQMYDELWSAVRRIELELRAEGGDPTADLLARKAFEKYLDLRFRLLPSWMIEKLEQLLENHQIYAKPGGDYQSFGAFYDHASRMISIVLAKEHRQSAMDYVLRIHELEHAIQYLHTAPEQFPDEDSRLEADFTYVTEKGAMAAEGIYWRALPLRVRTSTYARMLKDPLLTRSDRRFLANFTDDGHFAQSTEDFLERQWQRGRYAPAVKMRFRFPRFARPLRP